MTIRTDIVVKFSFEGFHCWPQAPESCSFLRNLHRHMFHVRADKKVTHHDREIEIIELKNEMITYCEERWHDAESASCEMIAADLMRKFKLSYCQVLEDDENGASAMDLEDELKSVPESAKSSVSGKSRFNGSCFIGVECEGPEKIRGHITMFIPGHCSENELHAALTHALQHKMNIYYGADNDYIGLPSFCVQPLLLAQKNRWSKDRTSFLIIEVDRLFSYLQYVQSFSDCGVLWVTHAPNDMIGANIFYKKVVKNVDVIEWHGTESKHITRTDDPFFNGDSVFQGAK